MTNKRRIKRPPAVPVMDAARAAVPILAALDAAPARVPDVPPAVDVSIYPDAAGVLFVVPVYVASVNAWIHTDPAPRGSLTRGPFYRGRGARVTLTPGPSRYSGGVYKRPAASTTAAPNGPERPNDANQPNGLNGLSMPERPNDANQPNGLNGLSMPERPERLKLTLQAHTRPICSRTT